MLRSCSTWLLFCLVTTYARHLQQDSPEVPKARIGPFDRTNETDLSPAPEPERTSDGEIFQGDIRNAGRLVGNAGTLNPWPNAIIPYTFDCSVVNMPDAMKYAREAMAEWEARTCIKFVEKRPEDKAYLEFFRSAGCWATFVGYRKDTKTQISIGKGCDYKHVMVHEVGHVIGFWHEQSRRDRDDYITIDFKNVYPNLRYNFNKVKEQTHNYGEPYDYGSIMHYPWNAFAIHRGRNTIFPKKPLPSGKRPYVKLSDSDVAQANKMYKCEDLKKAREQVRGIEVAIENAPGSFSDGQKCEDGERHCPSWAKAGHCKVAADPMLKLCRKSCDNCGPAIDNYPSCKAWADYGFCRKHSYFMLRECKVSCGVVKAAVATTKPTPEIKTTIPTTIQTTIRTTTQKTTQPTTQTTTQTTKPTTIVPTQGETITLPTKKYKGTKCIDRSSTCGQWAKEGRCDRDIWVERNCLASCKRYDICDKEPIKPIGACTSPLRVGWTLAGRQLDDSNFYATSVFYPGSGWRAPASAGRLYATDDHGRRIIGASCGDPRRRNFEHYLQIDLGQRRKITAVATQGRPVYFEHVKSYSLEFSNDRRTWNEYQENGQKKIFDGNCDHFTPVMNILKHAQEARYIRFRVVKYTGAPCLRVEVYGC